MKVENKEHRKKKKKKKGNVLLQKMTFAVHHFGDRLV